MKFGENSFLMLQFKEGYRREQQRKEKESSSARKRREVSASQEQFSIRFRTRHDGMLFLAMDSAVTSVSGYTVLEVGLHLHVVLSFERNDAFVLCLLWLICGGRGGNVNGGGGGGGKNFPLPVSYRFLPISCQFQHQQQQQSLFEL